MEQTLLIITAAFFSSIVSGLTGMGGGFILLTILASFFSPITLIPLHGSLQLISNISRSLLFLRYINWRITGFFCLGAVFGAYCGSHFLVEIPKNHFRVILGISILGMTWMPKLKKVPKVKGLFIYVGGCATFLSLFIGATGPIIAPFFLKSNLIKEHLVATKAACQIPLHVFKITVYMSAGFLLYPWLLTLAVAIPAMVLGTWTGKKLLGKVPEEKFYKLLQLVITVLAPRMLIASGLTLV